MMPIQVGLLVPINIYQTCSIIYMASIYMLIVNQFSFVGLSINNSRQLVISISAGGHLGCGGHVSAGFNITEFLERLFD